MSYKVDKAGGGPYTHEIDAIRDERYRASVMGAKPDFHSVFDNTVISQGAFEVIRDIDKPIEPPVGDFVENVVFHDEEEAPAEEAPAESPVSGDTAAKESPAPETTGSKQGNAESTPAPVEQPAPVVELQAVLDPVTPDNDTPIYVEMEKTNVG
jgi:hypothetical protein